MTISITDPGLDLAAGFEDLGACLRDHPAIAARMAGRRIVNIPLAGATADERIADLHAVARDLGTVVEWHGECLSAAAHFGGVTLEAHHNPAAFLTIQGVKR